MTNENIIAGNKLIAEFMGLEKCVYNERITNINHPRYKKPLICECFCMDENSDIVSNIYTDVPGYHWNYDKEDENGNVINRLLFFDNDLKYHSSYDWLMPVVHKILDICHEGMLNEWEYSFANKFLACDIIALYNEAITFIEWYNAQKTV